MYRVVAIETCIFLLTLSWVDKSRVPGPDAWNSTSMRNELFKHRVRDGGHLGQADQPWEGEVVIPLRSIQQKTSGQPPPPKKKKTSSCCSHLLVWITTLSTFVSLPILSASRARSSLLHVSAGSVSCGRVGLLSRMMKMKVTRGWLGWHGSRS